MIDTAKLKEAAKLITEAVEDANVDSETCDGCGCRRYDDFQESSATKESRCMIEKLRRWARQFG